MSWRHPYIIYLFLILLIATSDHLTSGQSLDESPIANISSSWQNSVSLDVMYTKPVKFQPILTRGSPVGPWFSCGFGCNYNNSGCLLAVLMFPNSSMTKHPQVVWSANRNNPVWANATLELGKDGNLALIDSNGNMTWSTNTSGKAVTGLNLTEMGNLVLFDGSNKVIWQSFDHPTDTLVPGQMLVSGRKLISNVSSTDGAEGFYSMFLDNNRLVAQLMSSPPQLYYQYSVGFNLPIDSTGRAYVEFGNGTFGGLISNSPTRARFLRLEADGHLKAYEWRELEWVEVSDAFTPVIGDCGYPMVCGNYGICSGGQCSCPEAASRKGNYFFPKALRHPNLGCSLNAPISCEYSQYHSLVEIRNVSYFGFATRMSSGEITLLNCQRTCLESCSCKLALFRYPELGDSNGTCFLIPEVLSLMDLGDSNSTIAYVKVQLQLQHHSRRETWRLTIILVTTLGFFGTSLVVSTWFILYRRKTKSEEAVQGYIDQLKGMPTRFSYEQLRIATENFRRKLGEGGFGTVFEGTLSNGTKVAVKLLHRLDLAEMTFLAEVETIGSIHHVNLVRLMGFCAEKLYRLLVYEYMSNGSLNEWIFPDNLVVSLRWQFRRKIILDIAKGLAYLHGECRQKIFHLDIKPQNILLDKNFNAKVSDFGLSKLIDKDQSKVVTTMKGTPGYMAPEWLSSVITEKVDVYSFGVMVLEVLCGRRNLDLSQPEEDMYLLNLFKRKAEEGQLLDLVDKHGENMQMHGEEVVEMMKVAAWCLQADFEERPSMTMVVQVLEGLANVHDYMEYNFSGRTIRRRMVVTNNQNEVAPAAAANSVEPFVLSGPR